MTRIGLIRNPNSQRNRRLGDRIAEVSVPKGIELLRIDPDTADDVARVVRLYGTRRCSHLIVDGGDGTLRDVMSALPGAFPEALPTLMLMAGGNANLATQDVGGTAHGPEALQDLLDLVASEGGRLRRRRPIEIRWPDGSRPPVLSFFVGAAAFHLGWKLALGSVHRKGLLHGPAVAATIAGAVVQTLAGGKANPWRAGTDMGIGHDDAPERDGTRFLFIATTLNRLVGGIWPFFAQGTECLRWLDIDAPPQRLLRTLPGLMRGEPGRWAIDSGGYRSGSSDRITLRLQAPLVIDGEAYPPDAYGRLELHAGPELAFLSVTP